MTAWASGAWASGAWTGTAWQVAAPVTVPDVVGLTQADAITALEGAGFVVSVETATSSTVLAGLVISQAPVGGSDSTAGATVIIVVSSGEVDAANDPKLIARPNVRMRGLRKRKDETPPPPAIVEPAEALLARGLTRALDAVDEIPTPTSESPPATAALPAKARPALNVVVAPAMPSGSDAMSVGTPTGALIEPVPPNLAADVNITVASALKTLPVALVEGVAAAMMPMVNGMVSAINELRIENQSFRHDLGAVHQELIKLQKARDLWERNQVRAQQIADRLLKDSGE
jgi:hypothetical protein